MWYKELFSFPSWTSSTICWKCKATKETYKDFGGKAVWRSQRLSPTSFFAQQREHGVSPSPLFNAIGFSLDMVMIDVLHCMDLGCTQDILGNIFWEAIDWLCTTGRTKKDKVAELWSKVRVYYSQLQPPTQLQGLTLEMIKGQKKAPKLRAKGAETRHLVPFAVLLAEEMAQVRGDTHGITVLRIASNLFDVYNIFSCEPFDAKECAESCRRLCLLYASMNPAAQDDPSQGWRVKPKFHMMCELCEYQAPEFGSPQEFWAYADESFVGFVAEFSHKRGGAANATSTSENVLNRFRALSSQV